MESGNFPSLDHLTRLGSRDGVDMRPTLIRVLTDLYVQKLTHTVEEKRHYTELALRLLDAVDVATRVAVASRLARHLSPPVRVIARLAADVPEVAGLVRSHPVRQPKPAQNVVAPPAPLVPTASSSPPIPLAPPAPPVARGPDPIKPPERAAPAAPVLPPKREVPQQRAAAMPDAIAADTAGELNELFFAASADERRLILLNLHIAVPMPAGRIGLSREAVVIQRLENAALSRNHEDFIAFLAQALRVPRAQARRIAADDLGEPIVAAAKALGMPRDVLYRILLFVNTTIGHSVARVHALAALFDEMTAQAAEHMIAIWQALPNHEHTAHQPLSRDEEARARSATAAVRRAPSSRWTGDRRDVS